MKHANSDTEPARTAMVNARDVAQAAGVSVSTVSRALASPELVAAQTRDRVLTEASRLGYRPNVAARGLRMGRTQTIGLVVPDLENPCFSSVARAVQARARGAGYVTVVVDSDEDPDSEPDLITVLRQRTDGVVLASPRSSDATLTRAMGAAPGVVLSRVIPGIPCVVADDAGGTEQLLGHLWALGHRRIAAAAGPERSWSGGRRLAGLRAAANRFGDVELVELGPFLPHYSGGVQAGDHAVASGATAVVAFNDLMAVGLLARLRARGVRVPQGMSVAGFDDISVAGLIDPPLTTLRTPRAALSYRAVELLVAALDSPTPTLDPDYVFSLPVELVIRTSSGEAPGPAPPHSARAKVIATT